VRGECTQGAVGTGVSPSGGTQRAPACVVDARVVIRKHRVSGMGGRGVCGWMADGCYLGCYRCEVCV